MKIGTNLADPSNSSSEQPFLNIFKTAGNWFTRLNGVGTGEEALLYSSFLDASGYPTTLTGGVTHTFNQLQVFLFVGTDPYFYRAGTYVFLYDGTGTFTFNNDFTKVTETAQNGTAGLGRILLTAVPSTNGTTITLATTGAGAAYAKNFRLVYAPTATASVIDPNETALANGEKFDPDFIARISSFKTLRFMNWMQTLRSYQVNWADRPPLDWPFWNDGFHFNNAGNPGGEEGIVPLEVMCALCNKIGADPWFCMPMLSTDDYVTQFATLAHSRLNVDRKVYMEYGNEMWNQGEIDSGLQGSGGPSGGGVRALGYAAFTVGSDFGAVFFYGVLRTVQNGVSWKTAWGADSARVVVLYAGATPDLGLSTSGLDWTNSTYFTGTASTHFDAYAMAPYFGDYNLPLAWSDNNLGFLFTELKVGGLLPDGSSPITTGGTSTAYTATSGQSLPATPPNGTIVCVNINQNSGANPTFDADGSTLHYPIQDGFGVATTISSGVVNLVFTSKTFSGPVVTPGWRTQDLGYVGGAVKRATDRVTSHSALAVARGLPLICYEGGQTLQGSTNSDRLNFYRAANRHEMMFKVHVDYLTTCQANGVSAFNNFTDVGAMTDQSCQFGYWGALESVLQQHSPKHDALLQFINPNRRGSNLGGGF